MKVQLKDIKKGDKFILAGTVNHNGVSFNHDISFPVVADNDAKDGGEGLVFITYDGGLRKFQASLDYLVELVEEEAPITVRPQLAYSQAFLIMDNAKVACARQPSLRLGQAIFNALPPEIYKSYTGTDLDFFYWEDNHKVRETFWRDYVSDDLYLEYVSNDQVR